MKIIDFKRELLNQAEFLATRRHWNKRKLKKWMRKKFTPCGDVCLMCGGNLTETEENDRECYGCGHKW